MTITATWVIELNCTCPHCKDDVDLLDDPDFWDGRRLDIGEHSTDRSSDVRVVCPKCGEAFTVDLAY